MSDFFFSRGEGKGVGISGPTGIRCFPSARKRVPERLLALFLMKRTSLRPAWHNQTSPMGCGGFKDFLCSPLVGEDEPNLTIIFFKWVETTNQHGLKRFKNTIFF